MRSAVDQRCSTLQLMRQSLGVQKPIRTQGSLRISSIGAKFLLTYIHEAAMLTPGAAFRGHTNMCGWFILQRLKRVSN